MSGFRHLAEVMHVATPGRGAIDITELVQRTVAAVGVQTGICNLFIHHTSASLIICENADPAVRLDLERFMTRLAPDGDSLFEHTDEGPDDMPAHVRTILTQTSLSIPIDNGRCDLGTWQGVYVWEHRHTPHRRRLTISVLGT